MVRFARLFPDLATAPGFPMLSAERREESSKLKVQRSREEPRSQGPVRLHRGNRTGARWGCARGRFRYSATMAPEQIIGLALTLLVMAVGVAGSVLPGIPGTPLVLAAALIHKWIFGAASADWPVIVVLTGIMVLSVVMDLAATLFGAKKLGATWKGILGAVIGVGVGLFFGVPGIIVGPFVGAVTLEMLGGRGWRAATKAGTGALIGLLVGTLGKFACAVAMMGLFAVEVVARWLRTGGAS